MAVNEAMANDVSNTPRSVGVNGYPISATSLLDRQAIKKQLINGKTSHLLHSSTATSSLRQRSLPPSSTGSIPLCPSTSKFSKDDVDLTYGTKGRSKYPTSSGSPNLVSTPQFDPLQLLNPKGIGAASKHKRPAPGEASTSRPPVSHSPAQLEDLNSSHDGHLHQSGHDKTSAAQGMGSMIERIHNVSSREDRPQKKQKTSHSTDDDDGERKETTFIGGGKGGEVGEYMRQKRKEGLQESVASRAVVDLTGGDDDDVVVVSDSGDKEVCYGRLESTKVNAHMVPFPKQTATYISKSDWPVSKLELRRTRSKNIIIRVIDPTGKDFGSVDVRTSSGLVPIMDSSNMKARVQARLNRRQKDPSDIPGKECSAYLDMTVNLYGPKKNAEAIGKFLSQKQLYLRTPFGVDAGIEVYNPHSLHLSSLPRTGLTGSAASSAGSGAGTGYSTRTVEEVRNDVMSMFDSLEKSDTLPEMKPDTRVKTELLSHQKQALYFMTKKEKARVFGNKDEDKNSLWRLKLRPNGQRIYLNVITGKEERTKPPEVLGGILADEMGLGKTLSILSLIVGSSADSQEWGKQKPPTQQTQDSYVLKRNSKSTLLVAPVSTIANWEEQMKIHLQPGTLKHLVYHGNNRCQNIDALAQYDMIITTYQIISSEFCGRSTKRGASPLFHTNFFRIVLDEAHTIREPSTKQSQAICTLQGQRRWAVTGTPVQNRLDDLGALIKFLQVKPFDDKGGFAQFILSPFKNADPEILPKLRLLVDSITLRRLKDRIDLPPRKDEIIRLEFSNEERPLYELFAKDSHAKMSVIVGRQNQKKGLAGKSYAHVLRSLLRLRLICAHGKELLGEDDLKMMEGQSQSNAIDLSDEGGEKQVMTSRQVYEMLMLLRESDMDLCAQCARKIEPKESIPEDSPENEVIGHMLPCYQIVCQDCILAFKKTVKENATVDNHFTCPFCEQYLQVSFFELTQSGIEAAEDAKIKARKSPKQAKIMGRYDGPHTKTRALIDSLLQAQVESMANLDQAPIKSVVFSGWTSHLDLIQVALDDHLIKYTRLDGTMNLVQRSAALEVFAHDPDVRVILVSIAAGGVGLNLTAGSRVFIMEPQFNPAAEAQAIDRVHRLGQKKQVVSTRYIMQDSVEEKMLELQRKKQDLANLSMNRGKLDKAEAAKRRLEDLKSLFK